MQYTVYRHVNVLNGKSYVGVTKHCISKRWFQHCHDAERGSSYAFHKAIRKHGKHAFKHESLYTCVVLQDALDHEAFWVNRLGTLVTEHDYNMREGGNGSHCWSDETRKLHKKHTSIGTKRAFQRPEIKERHRVATGLAANAPENRERRRKNQLAVWKRPGYREHISRVSKKTWNDPSLFALRARCKAVTQFDTDGNIIATFVSARSAARILGLSQGSISNVARGRTRTAGGYVWRYVSNDE